MHNKTINNSFLIAFAADDSTYQDIGDEFANACYDIETSLWRAEGASMPWEYRSKRPPTTCHTSGRRLGAGYTRSGKYRPSKWIPAKSDRRVGK